MKESTTKSGRPKKKAFKKYLPPLADPVFTMIFLNEMVAGLALLSFLNAILADSGHPPISEVVKIISQSDHPNVRDKRSYRLDVEAVTSSGEIILIEVLLYTFKALIERLWLYASSSLASEANRGEKLEDSAANMPRVITVAIINFELELNNPNFHSTIGFFTEEEPGYPYERVIDRLSMHIISLPRFRRIKIDPNNPLHLWLDAFCACQFNGITIMEALNQSEYLAEYFRNNPGFAQFVKRFDLIASDKENYELYTRWLAHEATEALHRERFKAEFEAKGKAEGLAEGLAEGKAEGLAEGKAETLMEVALELFREASSDAEFPGVVKTLERLKTPGDIIEKALKKVKAEKARKSRAVTKPPQRPKRTPESKS